MCLNFCEGNVVVKFDNKERKHHGVNTVDCYSITSNGCREISASYESILRIMEITQ